MSKHDVPAVEGSLTSRAAQIGRAFGGCRACGRCVTDGKERFIEKINGQWHPTDEPQPTWICSQCWDSYIGL